MWIEWKPLEAKTTTASVVECSRSIECTVAWFIQFVGLFSFSRAVAIELASGQQCILWLPWSMANNKHWSGVSTNHFYYRFQSTFFYHSPLFISWMHPFKLFVRMKNVFFSIFFSFASLSARQSLWMNKNYISQCSSSAICYKTILQYDWLRQTKREDEKNTYFYSFLYGAAFCLFDWNRNGNEVKRNGILSMIHCTWDPARSESYFNWKSFFYTPLH